MYEAKAHKKSPMNRDLNTSESFRKPPIAGQPQNNLKSSRNDQNTGSKSNRLDHHSSGGAGFEFSVHSSQNNPAVTNDLR